MSLKLLYVPLSPEVRAELCRRARHEHRRPQDEAAVLIEGALGLRARPATPESNDETTLVEVRDDAASA